MPGEVVEPTEPTETVEAAPAGDACALLDADYLNEALSGVESTFGGALDFREPYQTPPSAFCSWNDAGGGISIELLVEDASTAEVDDHSGRAYNIDVEPVAEPQSGPGEKAVMLLDTAFVDTGADPFAYGYFFVDGSLAVYLKTVGVEIGPDMLRALADEADSRIPAS